MRESERGASKLTARLVCGAQRDGCDHGGRCVIVIIGQPQGHGSREASASDGHRDGAVAVDLDRDAATRDRDDDGIVLGNDQAGHDKTLVGDGTTVEMDLQLRVVGIIQPHCKSTGAKSTTVSGHVRKTKHVGHGSAGSSRLDGHGEFIVQRQSDDTLVAAANGAEVGVLKDRGARCRVNITRDGQRTSQARKRQLRHTSNKS